MILPQGFLAMLCRQSRMFSTELYPIAGNASLMIAVFIGNVIGPADGQGQLPSRLFAVRSAAFRRKGPLESGTVNDFGRPRSRGAGRSTDVTRERGTKEIAAMAQPESVFSAAIIAVSG
jgi:hypothetical protein